MMGIEALDHVNLRTRRIEAMRAFYAETIGLAAVPAGHGWRLAAKGRSVVHLIPADAAEPSACPQLEHFAFRASGLRPFMDRLDRLGCAFNLFRDEATATIRVNLRDPDDNRLHVDFPIAEHEPGMAPRRASTR